MTREQQTSILLIFGFIVAAFCFFLYMKSENRAAIATGDYSRCQFSGCASEITNRITGN